MRQSTGIERDAELVLAARNGDPWAREQLVTAHLPLIRTTVALAMSGRGGAERGEVDHVEHVVRETTLRALDGLHAVSDPGTFRPWLVAIAVDGIRRHRHAQPAGFGYGDTTIPAAGRQHPTDQAYEITTAARWLDPDDGELLALWRLECTGELTRYETAAALRWSVEDTTARVEALQARFDAARVVAGALSENPPCSFLSREAAGWDGRPSAPWRDHLAQHTLACAHCATRWNGLVPAAFLLTATAPEGSPGASEDDRERAIPSYAPVSYETTEQPYAAAMGDLTEPYVLAGHPEPDHPRISRHGAATASSTASSVPGRRGSRAALRRRRQTQERGRRRAVIAAGVVVMAVTGGAFSLHGGRGGNDELLEANRLSAPGPDVPVAHDPSAHSAAPLTTSANPSASPSTSKSAAARPSRPASPTARPTTAPPRPTRTTPPVQVKTTPPRTTAPASPSQSTNTGTGTGTGTGSGSGSNPTTNTGTSTGADAGTNSGGGTGAGAQNDQGQSSAADQVVALVNAERAKAGCGPLSANATLTKAAQGHSEDMAARDFFDHTDPDGDGPGERVTEAGYPWSTYGENIAMGQSTPEQVMDSWMNSPGHRANILNCSFKEIGIGIHSEGGPYWTQVFGAR
ncbi:CAP domain-containing protein [Streptomyces sp. SBC-4]|nr:CAP domain-containing protein [Streptomyces sp. SBC-4]MDV5142818.1 CAP domain-containing protein [Streptomyces sp. SBC-4]